MTPPAPEANVMQSDRELAYAFTRTRNMRGSGGITILAKMVAEYREALIEQAAKACEAYSEVNFEMAGDGVLLDPILRGGEWTPENVATSENMQIHSTIHAAQAHAGQHLAAAIRALNRPAEGEDRG